MGKPPTDKDSTLGSELVSVSQILHVRLRGRKNPCMPWAGYPKAEPRSPARRHAMNSAILAIDLGKFNSVLCWYDPDARTERFRTAPTTPDDLRRELLRQPVARVVFEACSQAGWVHDLCEQIGVPAVVASTTGAAWQWKHVKRKTDRDDALKLARLAAVGQIEAVPVPPRAVRQWKSLTGLRKRLVAERVRGQNRV